MSEIVNIDNMINIIVSQTNYTVEEAEVKYNEWNGDHISVIKEYLNPNFQKKISPDKKLIFFSGSFL